MEHSLYEVNFPEGLSTWRNSIPSGVCGEVFSKTEGIVTEYIRECEFINRNWAINQQN
jgi:hypothetical protein